ncbi:MAG TPA: amino acid ABC transporter substrate-binding protein [Methylomirabilota bacterium]|nr:amino acid ABC transporter substrate-binding protein [Methylomirabilota bacterium]
MHGLLPRFGLVPVALPFAADARGGGAQAAAPDAILVGGTISMTGPFGPDVAPFKKLMESWAEMVNAKGGISLRGYGKTLPLKFIIYDDASKPDESVRLYEKLVTEHKVHALFGPYSSSLTAQASTVGEKHQIPFIAIEANAWALYQRGFKWLVGVLDSGLKWSYHYFDLLKAEGKAKTIAFIVEDSPHPKEVAAGSIPKAKETGLRVVAEEHLTASMQDFSPIIDRIKALDPDIVYVSTYPLRGGALHKQAVQRRLSPREFHYIHHGSAFREPAGIKNVNFVTGENFWMPGVKGGPNVPEFEELLKRAGIKVEDHMEAPARFLGCEIFRVALERAGTLDPAKLIAALRGLAIISISGSLKIDPATGQGSRSPYPTQIQEGKYVTLWPPVYATGKHIYPRPQ